MKKSTLSTDTWNPMLEAFNDSSFNSYGCQTFRSSSCKEDELHVSGIPNTMTENGLCNLFSSAGQVKSIRLLPATKNLNKQIGFVKTGCRQDCLNIIGKFNNYAIKDTCLKISFAKSRTTPNMQSHFSSIGAVSSSSKIEIGVGAGRNTFETGELTIKSAGRGNSWNKSEKNNVHTLSGATSSSTKALEGSGDITDATVLPESLSSNMPDKPSCSKFTRVGDCLDADNSVPLNLQKNIVHGCNIKLSSCEACQKPAHFRCGNCKSKSYCSRNCQSNDWIHHKLVCEKKSRFEEMFEKRFQIVIDESALTKTISNTNGCKSVADDTVTCSMINGAVLPLNEVAEVVLSAVENLPSEFWVIKNCNVSFINELRMKLDKHYSNSSIAHPSTEQLAVGLYFACQFSEDNGWYRVQIESIKTDGNVVVRYIEYGNTEVVSMTRLRELDEDFLIEPWMAVKCSIAHIMPASSVWSDDATRLCHKFVSQYSECSVTPMSRESGVHYVSLLTKDKIDLADELVKSCFAKRKVTVVSDTSLQNVSYRHLHIPEVNYPTGGKYLIGNMEISVKVLQIISPEQFWVHNQSSSDCQKLDFMTEAMSKHYAGLRAKSGFRPIGDKLYAVLDKDNGKWYRVQALKFNTETVQVFYLDYGNVEIVSTKHLHSLESQFLTLPFQAIRCSLVNMRDYCQNYTIESTEYFQQLVFNEQSLRAIVSDVLDCNICIEIYLASGQAVSDLMCQFFNTINVNFRPSAVEKQTSDFYDSEPLCNVLQDCKQLQYSMDSTIGEQNKLTTIQDDDQHQLQADKTSLMTVQACNASNSIIIEPLIGDSVQKLDHPNLLRSEDSHCKFCAANECKCEAQLCCHNDADLTTPRTNSNLVAKDPNVGNVKEGNRYVVKILHCPTPSNITVCFTQDATKLESLTSDLNSVLHQAGHQPQVGELVAAQYVDDMRWYRARVLLLCDDNTLRVNYVDFGNEATVKANMVAKLEPKYSVQPVWSMLVELVDAHALKMCWNNGKVMGKYVELLMVVVKSNCPILLVQLFEIESGLSVLDALQQSCRTPVTCSSEVTHHSTTISTQPSGHLLEIGAQVTVVYIESPSSFYVHLSTKQFQQAMELIEEHFSRTLTALDLVENKFAVGNLVAAKYDDAWCRARIVEISQLGSLKLLFIDYGNVDTMSASDVTLLPSGLPLELPPQAICCSVSKQDRWLPETVNWFKTTCEYKCFSIVGECSLGDNQKYLVDIKSVDSEQTVRQLLLKSDCLFRNVSDETEEVIKYKVANDILEVSVANLALSENVSNLELQPVADADVHGWCLGSEKVLIVHSNSPSDFYIQTTNLDTLTKLSQLMSRISITCSESAVSIFTPVVGEIVAARYVDGDWYRAQIIELKSVDNFLVHFVDYGNASIVSLSEIRQIPTEFSVALPKQAVHCAIDRVIGDGEHGEWSINAKMKFNLSCLDKLFYLKFVFKNQTNLCWHVDLVCNESKQTIRDMLLAERLAKISSSLDSLSQHVCSVDSLGVTECQGSLSIATDKVVCLSDRISNSRPLCPGMGVLVTFISSPSNFYLQITDDESLNMLSQLNNFCSMETECYQPQQVGQVVLVRHDCKWYRAEVLEIYPHSASVLCFDYGVIHHVDLKNMYYLPVNLVDCFPRLSIKCGIIGIQGSEPDDSFSEQAKEWFYKTCILSECIVTEVFNTPEKCLVDLSSSKCTKSVKNQLLDKGMACNQVSSLSIDREQDVTKVCEFQQRKQFSNNTEPKVGMRVLVAHTLTPSDFYLQSFSDEDIEVLRKIVTDLQNHCNAINNGYQPSYVSEPVAAKYQEMWHRAEVTELLANGEYRVVFVDYGNYDSICVENIRVLPIELINIAPRLAFHCAIEGIAGETLELYSQSEIDCFKNILPDESICSILSLQLGHSSKFMIDIISGDCNDGVSVKNQMLAMGFQDLNKTNTREDLCQKYESSIPQTEKVQSIILRDGEFVRIVNAESPTNLYIRLQYNMLFEIQKKVKQAVDNNKPYYPTYIGEMVAVIYDGTWSRAEVNAILSSDRVSVHCIDFGVCFELSTTMVRYLPWHCIQGLPKQTVHCVLEGFENQCHFSDQCLNKLRLCCESDIFKVFVVKSSGQCVVNLINISNDVSLSALLHQTDEESESVPFIWNKSDSQVHRDELAKENLPLVVENARVSCIIGSAKFYCYPFATVVTLQKTVNALCNTNSSPSEKLEPCENGLYLAFCSESGEWCRAVVEGCAASVGHERYIVLFIDYGNKATVDISRIRQFPQSLLKVPAQARVCTLAGVQTTGQLVNVNTSKFFQQLVSKKKLTVRTEDVDECGVHNVLLIDEASGQCINNELLKRRLVSPHN